MGSDMTFSSCCLPAPERLGGLIERLFAGETHVAEQPPFLSKLS